MAPQPLQPDEAARIDSTARYYLNRLAERPSTTQMARRAAVGETKLQDYFRGVYGLTVQRWLHLSRLRTAQLLLRNTDQPIKAVGRVCGYSHYKNFLTAYRREFGRRPGEERRKTNS